MQRLKRHTGFRACGSRGPHRLHASARSVIDCGRATAGAQSYGAAQPYYEAAALFQPLKRQWALTAAACLRCTGTLAQARAHAPRPLLGARAPAAPAAFWSLVRARQASARYQALLEAEAKYQELLALEQARPGAARALCGPGRPAAILILHVPASGAVLKACGICCSHRPAAQRARPPTRRGCHLQAAVRRRRERAAKVPPLVRMLGGLHPALAARVG